MIFNKGDLVEWKEDVDPYPGLRIKDLGVVENISRKSLKSWFNIKVYWFRIESQYTHNESSLKKASK